MMHMDQRTDDELLLACREGDQAALTVLIARHEDLVRRACRRQAPAGDVEDCVQAVFVVLARRPAAAAGSVALAPWLLRVAWHVSNRARRAGERRRRAEAAAAADGAARQTAPLPEASEHLDDCLNRLPEQQRAAICLHFLSSLSPEDVAARLGTSRDNAYKLITRGLSTLRDLLARRGVAITGVALGSMLAGEAQAAAPGQIILSVQPTAKATALAQGTITAMKLSAFLPLAGIAGLLVAVGTTTMLLTAEPATSSPTAPAPSPATQPAPIVAPVSTPAAAPKDLSGSWNARDTKEATAQLADRILKHAWIAGFAQQQGRRPLLRLGKIVARCEGEVIDTEVIRDGLRHQMSESPAVRLLADAAGPVAGGAVEDASLTGSIVLEASVKGTSSIRLYTVTITGADGTGVQVLSEQCKIRKEIVGRSK
jgi:RNA polymerase sigma-70 factor (ECF subfamily)